MKKILVVCLMVVSSTAFAAGGNKKFSIGGNVGYGMASVENNGVSVSFSGLSYGAQLDLGIGPRFSLGVDWSYFKDDNSIVIPLIGTFTIESTMMPVLANVSYWFQGFGKGLYAGIAGGIIMGKSTVGATETTGNDTAFGGRLGYEFDLGAHFGFGLQANYNYVMADTAFSYFSFVAPIKFYF